MAIDPSIALQVKPVQFDSAGIVNMLQQGQALRMQKESHAQQMQLGQQALQEGALGLQEKQRQVTEGQQLRDVFKPTVGPDGQPVMPDIRAALPKIMAINPNVGMAMQKSLHEQEKSALDVQKTGIEVKAKQAERFGAIAGTIKDEASFHQGITTALTEGLIKSDDAAKLLAQGWDNPQTQALVQQIAQGAIGAKEQHDMGLADIKAKQEKLASDHAAELYPSQVTEAKGKADQVTREQTARDNPNDPNAQSAALTADQRLQLKERADMIAKLNTPAELAFKASDPKAPPEQRQAAKDALKILEQHAIASRPVMNMTVAPGLAAGGDRQATGEDFIKTLDPGAASQVKAIAEGRATMPSATSRSQAALQLRDAVFRFDPNYSDQSAQIRKARTTGKAADNIGALNTATVHLDQLADIGKALGNNTFRPGNQFFNAARTMFGDATPTNFNGLKAAVAGEMANALKGNATDIEIHQISETISNASSPEQLQGIIQTNLHTLGAKLNTYSERFSLPNDKWNPVLPSAGAVYQKHGINPIGGGAANLPKGSGQVIDKATAQQFYRAAGGDPAKAQQLATQAGWKVQ